MTIKVDLSVEMVVEWCKLLNAGKELYLQNKQGLITYHAVPSSRKIGMEVKVRNFDEELSKKIIDVLGRGNDIVLKVEGGTLVALKLDRHLIYKTLI